MLIKLFLLHVFLCWIFKIVFSGLDFFTKIRCYSSHLATGLKLSFLCENKPGDMCPDDLTLYLLEQYFFWHHLHLACCKKRSMVKAPKVPGSEIHNKESRDICDPTVEGHDRLSVPPNQSTSKGKAENHRPSYHVSCPILFPFDLEILWFHWGTISECKFLIQGRAYPRTEKELQTFPLSHNTS